MRSPEIAPVPTVPLAEAFSRYEAIRARLPAATFAGAPRPTTSLLEVADRYDGFVFDSYGVLNVGETAIPGAADCLEALRARGTPFCVLTNAASHGRDGALDKYRRAGLPIRLAEIVSSRDVAVGQLAAVAEGVVWAAISDGRDDFGDIGAPVVDLIDGGDWSGAEAFLFLSSARWNADLQERLVAELRARPRPVVVANPDLVAPREAGLSLEPGWWGHDIQDRTGIRPRFSGKPYGDAFAAAAARLPRGRLAMVGDTLHTDILGGRAAGMDTILVTDHGLFAGERIEGWLTRSGIAPDWIVPGI